MVENSEEHLELAGIKIMMLAPCLGKFGGIETFSLTLIEDLLKRGAIIKLLRKKVSGFSLDGSIEQNELEIRDSWAPEISKRFKSEYVLPRDLKIKKSIAESDLVHLHNPMIEGVWYAKRFRKPCVMTIYNWRRRGLSPRILLWNWAVKNVDRRWYISEFVWDSWESKRRKNSARLPVVSRLPTGDIPLKERKGFLFIGRWVPNKGIRILLKAYQKLSPNNEEWPLTLLGDGPLRKQIMKIIEDEKIRGVNLPGFVSESERNRYIREAKWMVTPPHTKEDLGLTPLEARAVGVPCIASSDGGIKETAGKHALFCDPGNIDQLAACLEKAVSMNEDSYKQMSIFAKDELELYVRPLTEYTQEYLQLLKPR